jgi:hypothetical protein
LKKPETVQNEGLLVHLIARNQSQYIGDDAVRLINDFIYSHKKTIDIVSSTLESFSTLSSSVVDRGFFPNGCLYIILGSSNKHTTGSISAILMATITNYNRDRNVCYHECVIDHHLTVLDSNEKEGDKLFDAGICEALVKIKKIHSTDQRINSLVSDTIRESPKVKRPIERPFGIPYVNK